MTHLPVRCVECGQILHFADGYWEHLVLDFTHIPVPDIVPEVEPDVDS